ncbi:unnamed protein product [Protopolystoma xenopodis]|uniref:Uncharacterized protein n=1 Tax=Protopolystoma xenopodis TaxID=117903 RepID=A0A3S5CGZ7_9PLAT|nr:unnamed protein product [Protopolystoma xenopodis]
MCILSYVKPSVCCLFSFLIEKIRELKETVKDLTKDTVALESARARLESEKEQLDMSLKEAEETSYEYQVKEGKVWVQA